MLRLSRWVHCFERADIMAFWDPLLFNLVFVSKDLGTKIKTNATKPILETDLVFCVGKESVSVLKDQGFLVEDIHNDWEQFCELRERLLDKSTLELLYLLVTDDCNMRCSYCFEDSPVLVTPCRNVTMSFAIAKRAVDLFADLNSRYGDPQKNKTIHFYGGEPLLNKRIIEFTVKYIQDLIHRNVLSEFCQMAIVTNGLLMDEHIAHFLADNKVTVGLSLDGPENINNFYRLAKKQEINAFKKTMRALSILQSCGAQIGLSVTLTPLAVDHFDELIDFLLNQVGKIDGLSLNLLHFNRNVIPPHDYYERAARCQLIAFELFRKAGIYEERVMRKAKAFIKQQPMLGDCGALGNQLIIAPDGKIGVCQDFVKPRTYFYGNVLNKDIDPIADGLFKDWRQRSPFYMENCFNCPAIGICGGGCPASAELKTGSRWNIDERICHHSNFTLEWLIWETYSHVSLA